MICMVFFAKKGKIMSHIDKDGMLIHPKIVLKRFKHLEHGALPAVNGIVLHQTDSSTFQSTFNSYLKNDVGAHFLIAKNGVIYQTASLKKRCYHVGKLIKSKCLQINKSECKDKELAKILSFNWAKKVKMINKHERKKKYPNRFPVNSDSIGIEIVGKHINDRQYEMLTLLQTESMHFLIDELYTHFRLDKDDVYRHPEISYKHPGEAADTTW